jgi:hypothetical protein
MITLTKVRELDVSPSPDAAGTTYLSAASGLIRAGSFLYVVADDELHLGVFPATDNGPGHLVRLLDGELPTSRTERKEQKPDFETLALLPASDNFPEAAILALGSGSRRNRRFGALLGLDAQGAVRGTSKTVDLAPIFAPIDVLFSAPNIEGAVVVRDEVRVFQRGNKRDSINAIVRFSLSSFLDTLKPNHGRTLEAKAIDTIDLGRVDGIPLCFTDAAALPNGDMVFTAVAEDTDDTYKDGPCAAAAIGIVDDEGRLRRLLRLDAPLKIEGVDARADGDVIRLLLVTDADDPGIPGTLFSATICEDRTINSDLMR